jgi:ABC-2 type transport system ATP-binding protein
MQEVEAMCDRVIIINRGKIVADDKIEKLQQSLIKEYIISVQFKNSPAIESINAIDKNIKVFATKDGFTITANEDIRENIAQKAAENNWLILSMNLEENSLEQVFQSLTK